MKTTTFRRIAAALLALTLLAGLTACDSGKKGEDKDKQEQTANTEEPSDEPTDDQPEGEEPADLEPTVGVDPDVRENLQEKYYEAAEKEITADNADQVADKLAKEIEADMQN